MGQEIDYFAQDATLSKDRVASGEQRMPLRPLGPFSDVVIEELPDALEEAHKGQPSSLDDVLARTESYAGQLLSQPRLDNDVARLDALMVYAGAAHSGKLVGTNTSNLVKRYSQGRVPALTYEDIVKVNPICVADEVGQVVHRDPRTFTSGPVGADEEHFYLIHQDLEGVIEPPIVALKDALVATDINGDMPDEVVEQLRVGAKSLDILIGNTRQVGRKMKFFDAFRPYLNPIPEAYIAPTLPRKIFAGPSGAYSGTVHALDLLIIGASPDDEIVQYVRDNRRYIPKSDYVLLDEALHLSLQRKSLRDLVETHIYPDGLDGLFQDLGRHLLTFRHIHRGSVARQVPMLFKNQEQAGTGGITHVAMFLDKRIERIRSALETIDHRQMDTKVGDL